MLQEMCYLKGSLKKCIDTQESWKIRAGNAFFLNSGNVGDTGTDSLFHFWQKL